MSRASNLAGFVSAIYPDDNLNVGFLTTRNLNVTGVSTFAGSIDIIGGVSYAEVAGIATYATTAGIATYATTAGDATNAQGLTGTPDITVGSITSGDINSSDATFTGNVSVGGTLTYEDVTNVNVTGIITANNGISVPGGGIVVTGVVTATSFSGDGSDLSIKVRPGYGLSTSSEGLQIDVRPGYGISVSSLGIQIGDDWSNIPVLPEV